MYYTYRNTSFFYIIFCCVSYVYDVSSLLLYTSYNNNINDRALYKRSVLRSEMIFLLLLVYYYYLLVIEIGSYDFCRHPKILFFMIIIIMFWYMFDYVVNFSIAWQTPILKGLCSLLFIFCLYWTLMSVLYKFMNSENFAKTNNKILI